jgi:hypothetical protein
MQNELRHHKRLTFAAATPDKKATTMICSMADSDNIPYPLFACKRESRKKNYNTTQETLCRWNSSERKRL